MNNNDIAENFALLSKLIEIHGENSFKAKSYSNAAFTIEKLPVQLSALSYDKIFLIKGIGEATGKKIIEQLETGQLAVLKKYLLNTPSGILEMLSVKGIGPKKIAAIWKDLEIENLGELLYACGENRLSIYKGFGEKTQLNIKEAIELYLSHQGKYLYAQIENYACETNTQFKEAMPTKLFEITGDFKMQSEIIERLQWVTTSSKEELSNFLSSKNYEKIADDKNESHYKAQDNLLLIFYHASNNDFYQTLFQKNCSEEFLNEWQKKFPFKENYISEEEIFAKADVDFIPACLRERKGIIDDAQQHKLPSLIRPDDITAIIHSHSKWSDGLNTIEELAEAAIQQGFEYLVLSDHSKSAFYANGLTEERIFAQHQQIEELNKKYAPFKIFKSIESDILNDGSLDYPYEVLASFDLVITSIHSNLKMKEDKAMNRLLKAVQNPYTNILGHPTGRLLLSRNGYEVDHKKLIDACAENNVVIELNAHPKRLDIDWRWLHYCLEKDVLISIDPDAHSSFAFSNVRYGVLAAQKAGVTRNNNLSSFSLNQFEQFIKDQHKKRP